MKIQVKLKTETRTIENVLSVVVFTDDAGGDHINMDLEDHGDGIIVTLTEEPRGT